MWDRSPGTHPERRRLAGLGGALLVTLLAADAVAEPMTPPQIKAALAKLGVARITKLYEMGVLLQDPVRTTANRMVLVRNNWLPSEADARNAQKWYRAMGLDEYGQASSSKVACADQEAFCGIAPRFSYVIDPSHGYVAENKPAVVMEFDTGNAGWLHQVFTTSGCAFMTEGGGIYGLGRKGSISSCRNQFKDAHPTMGAVFNQWMADDLFDGKLVYLAVPRPAEQGVPDEDAFITLAVGMIKGPVSGLLTKLGPRLGPLPAGVCEAYVKVGAEPETAGLGIALSRDKLAQYLQGIVDKEGRRVAEEEPELELDEPPEPRPGSLDPGLEDPTFLPVQWIDTPSYAQSYLR